MSGWRAALVAVCIGGAVLLAGWLVGRGGEDGDPGTTASPAAGDLPVLACPIALERVCGELAGSLGTSVVRLEPEGSAPAGAVVLAAAADLPDTLEPGPVVGRSPVVIVMWRERALVLGASCGTGEIDTSCLASAFDRTWAEIGGDDGWGSFKLGLADPTRTEAALAAWSVLADAGIPQGLADSLRLRSDDDGALLLEMAQFGDSRADAAVATEVAVAAQFDNVLGRGGRFEVYYPDPGPWVEFVASGAGGKAERLIARLLESDLQEVVAAAGLRPVSGAGELPEGLGDPGTPAPPLDEARRAALIEAWIDLE